MGPVGRDLIVHVQPRAKLTAVTGVHGDAVKIRLAAPPVDGAANVELIRFLAERLGVPKTAVVIVRGQTARRKTVRINSIDAATALRRLLGE